MTRVAIVIPCYNEERRIHASLVRLDDVLSRFEQYSFTVVCVNDGSTDTTEHIISSYSPTSYTLESTSLNENSGKGAAIKAGIALVDADLYGYIDADLAIDIGAHLEDTLHALRKYDIVIGKRSSDKHAYSAIRRTISNIIDRGVKKVLGVPVADVQCGYKWFSKELRSLILDTETDRFAFDTAWIVAAARQKVSLYEIPVDWTHDQEGSSVQTKDGVRYLIDVFRMLDVQKSKKQFLWSYVGAAMLVTFALFGWTLSQGYFFSDDFTWLWHGSRIASGELGVLTAHMSSFYSPVLNAFYAALYPAVGFTPWVFYLAGLLIHIFVSVVLGQFAQRITGSGTTGLFATILFASVGSAFEPLVWIGSNMHSIAAMFVLLSIYMLYEAIVRKKHSFYLLSLLAYILALLTKEVAIVAFPLLVLLPIVVHKKISARLFTPIWYYGLTSIATAAYLYKQYLAQVNSVWVSTGTYALTPSQLLRLPTSLLDVFVPLTPVLSSNNALSIATLAVLLFVYVLYRFRTEPWFWYGAIWFVIAALPVIFFAAPEWWTPLASRYTYTMRIGFVLAVAIMLHRLLTDRGQVRVIQGLFVVLLASFVLHGVHTMRVVGQEYSYVYASGRTLVEVVSTLPEDEQSVAFDYMRPFTHNYAHIVGVVTLLTDRAESDIIFMSKDELAPTSSVYIRWDDARETYYLAH
jgi:dolichyl-phosphate beta-glucosyltransferase